MDETVGYYARRFILLITGQYILGYVCDYFLKKYPGRIGNDLCAIVIINLFVGAMLYEQIHNCRSISQFLISHVMIFVLFFTIYKILSM